MGGQHASRLQFCQDMSTYQKEKFVKKSCPFSNPSGFQNRHSPNSLTLSLRTLPAVVQARAADGVSTLDHYHRPQRATTWLSGKASHTHHPTQYCTAATFNCL